MQFVDNNCQEFTVKLMIRGFLQLDLLASFSCARTWSYTSGTFHAYSLSWGSTMYFAKETYCESTTLLKKSVAEDVKGDLLRLKANSFNQSNPSSPSTDSDHVFSIFLPLPPIFGACAISPWLDQRLWRSISQPISTLDEWCFVFELGKYEPTWETTSKGRKAPQQWRI